MRREIEKLIKNCLKEGVRDIKFFMLIMLLNILFVRIMSMCFGFLRESDVEIKVFNLLKF